MLKWNYQLKHIGGILMHQNKKIATISTLAGIGLLAGGALTYGLVNKSSNTAPANDNQYIVLDTEETEIYSSEGQYYSASELREEAQEEPITQNPSAEEKTQRSKPKANKTDDETKNDKESTDNLKDIIEKVKLASQNPEVVTKYASNDRLFNNNNEYNAAITRSIFAYQNPNAQIDSTVSQPQVTYRTIRPHQSQSTTDTRSAQYVKRRIQEILSRQEKQPNKKPSLTELGQIKHLTDQEREQFVRDLENTSDAKEQERLLSQAKQLEQERHNQKDLASKQPEETTPDVQPAPAQPHKPEINVEETIKQINEDKPSYIEPAEQHVQTPADQPADLIIPTPSSPQGAHVEDDSPEIQESKTYSVYADTSEELTMEELQEEIERHNDNK